MPFAISNHNAGSIPNVRTVKPSLRFGFHTAAAERRRPPQDPFSLGLGIMMETQQEMMRQGAEFIRAQAEANARLFALPLHFMNAWADALGGGSHRSERAHAHSRRDDDYSRQERTYQGETHSSSSRKSHNNHWNSNIPDDKKYPPLPTNYKTLGLDEPSEALFTELPPEPSRLRSLRDVEAAEKQLARFQVDLDALEGKKKKAFRKLSMENHPDRNPGDEAAETRFKDVSGANDAIDYAIERRKEILQAEADQLLSRREALERGSSSGQEQRWATFA